MYRSIRILKFVLKLVINCFSTTYGYTRVQNKRTIFNYIYVNRLNQISEVCPTACNCSQKKLCDFVTESNYVHRIYPYARFTLYTVLTSGKTRKMQGASVSGCSGGIMKMV